MFKTILTSSVLAAGLASATLLPTDAAYAEHGRNGAFAAGAAAGVVGGALLGSAARREPAPVYEEPACRWHRERIYDGDGMYHWRRVQVCD
jgi:hypothetical protein